MPTATKTKAKPTAAPARKPAKRLKETRKSLKETSGIQVVTFALDKLKPYERNPRKNDAAVPKMVASIKEFGFKIPILAKSDGSVIDGHLRLKAAAELKLKAVPAILCDDWTDAQIKAFRLLVNRSVSWADWDTDLLKLEMAELQELDFDLSMTGFEALEIENLFKDGLTSTAEAADAAAPVLPVEPVARTGDVWILGAHRLMCGDSTVVTEVEKLLAGAKPNLMVTDPPYGVEYDPKWRAEAGVNKNKAKMGAVENDDRCDWRDAWVLFPGAITYVWHAGRHAKQVQESLEASEFEIRSQIIWAKDRFALSRGHYHWQHEPCWYAVKKGATGNWLGDRSQSTLWQIKSRDDNGVGHGTQKPVDCMRRPMLNHTERGDEVYEPFSGSGTTIIAAETIGRVCFAMEILPAYVDVAVKRWQDFTGKTAILEGDGRTFDEIGQRS